MMKDQIIKACEEQQRVRLRPAAKDANAALLDWDWQLQYASKKDGVRIASHHYTYTFNWEDIRNYHADSARGKPYAFLNLTIQLQIVGDNVLCEPLVH